MQRLKSPPLLNKISCWITYPPDTKPKKTRDLASASGLYCIHFCCCFYSLFFCTYRKVTKAPADGEFAVAWKDGKNLPCCPSKLVPLPAVNTVFEAEDRKYIVEEYTKKVVKCRIVTAEKDSIATTPKPRVTRGAMATFRRQTRSAASAVSTCVFIACVLAFLNVSTCVFIACVLAFLNDCVLALS